MSHDHSSISALIGKPFYSWPLYLYKGLFVFNVQCKCKSLFRGLSSRPLLVSGVELVHTQKSLNILLLLLINSFINFTKKKHITLYRTIVAPDKIHEVKGKPGLVKQTSGITILKT